MPRICSIDRDPKKYDWVARRWTEGYAPNKMEKMSREAGITMKRETIQRHLRECVGTARRGKEVVYASYATKDVMAPEPAIPTQATKDVASLVQQQVISKLEAGEARVTVQHGLQAQNLLDRRAERAKDRELAVTLARILHSPPPPSSAIAVRPEPAAIEGEAVEIK